MMEEITYLMPYINEMYYGYYLWIVRLLNMNNFEIKSANVIYTFNLSCHNHLLSFVSGPGR